MPKKKTTKAKAVKKTIRKKVVKKTAVKKTTKKKPVKKIIRKKATSKTSATTTSKKRLAKPKKVKSASQKKSQSKAKKKVAKKRTPAKKEVTRRVVKKEIDVSSHKAAISFGITEEYAEEILTTHKKNDAPALHEEFARMLPLEMERSNHEPKTKNVLVSHVSNRQQQSPYVLDLQAMARKKQEKIKKKEVISQSLNDSKTIVMPAVSEKNVSDPVLKKRKPLFTKRKKQPITITQKGHRQKRREKKEDPILKGVSKQFTKTRTKLFPQIWLKPALSFATICLLVIAPIKGLNYVRAIVDSKTRIIETSQQAYEDLRIASESITNDSETAQEKFNAAKLNFSHAEESLDSLNLAVDNILTVMGNDQVESARHLTAAGTILADLGSNITTLFEEFYDKDTELPLTDKLVLIKEKAVALLPQITALEENITAVDPKAIPQEYRGDFTAIQGTATELTVRMKDFIAFIDEIADMLGHNYKRRYLFVFQNNNELRATGGFMGSMAIVDFHHGEITKLDIPGGGTYDFQGSQKILATAPQPLHLINTRWELQDTNWFFDFPTSAKQIEDYFEAAGGPSVDGVIAINATMMAELLKNTDPIDMPEYGKTISADNFIEQTQYAVEQEYDKKENKPKQFLADLAPKLLKNLFDPQKTDLLSVVKTIKQGLDQKEIQIYMNNPNHQARLKELNWTGEVQQTSKDYLAIVNTNIAGGKTDTFIEQHVEHISAIQPNGSIIDTVKITRKHTGDPDDSFSGKQNNSFMRIYVPEGAKLLRAEGFEKPETALFDVPKDYYKSDDRLTQVERNKRVHPQTGTIIYEAFGKTVFGNWVQTPAQTETTVTISYQLPYKIAYNKPSFIEKLFSTENEQIFYSIFYQKQSGVNNSTYNATIILPENLNIKWSYPANLRLHEKLANYSFTLDHDTLTGLVLEPK